MKKWYAVKVYAGQEQQAKKNIEMFVSRKNLGSVISKIEIPLINTFENKKRSKKISSEEGYAWLYYYKFRY